MTLPNANVSDPGRMPSAKTSADPELVAVKRLVGLLDRSYRNSTLYGKGSAAAQRFVEQFQVELTSHLALFGTLTLVVQGFRLLCKGEVVYENPSPLENLAFKLFSDGIRELAFKQNISKDDIAYFLHALEGEHGAAVSDEDIVSRLWQKNLPTISLVTAEEIVKSLDSATVIKPQDVDIMNRPAAQISTIHKDEKGRLTQQKTSEAGGHGSDRSSAQGSDLAAQYQVSKEELDKLAREIEEESRKSSATLVMEMLTAILISEQTPVVLLKALDACREVLLKLIEQGHWGQFNRILDLLGEVSNRPDITVEYKMKLGEVREQLAAPELLRSLATVLNQSSQSNFTDLLPFLLRFNASAIPVLCALLGKLQSREHRAVVCQALQVLAKDDPEPLLQQLNQPAGEFVIDLMTVLLQMVRSHEERMETYMEVYSNVGMTLRDRVAQALAQAAHHKDRKVKLEALHAFSELCPAGNGIPLMAFLLDESDGVRTAALKQLANGRYSVPFSAWSPIVSSETFLNGPASEKQAVFTAMERTARAEAVPYWRELLMRWSWTNRAQVRELATLAAAFLGRAGTPAAIEALETGMKRWDRTIRNACKAARASLDKQARGAASSGQPS